LNLALSLATHALRSDGIDRGPYIENIDGITSTDLRKAASEYLSKNRYVFISVVPKK
jgi:predicted Zn-dependent peptidase